MAKNSIPDYSATAASNTDIQSVNIDEGCAPSGINNAIRELMVDLKNMDTGAVALTSPQMTSIDINGGTVDGVTLGTNSAVTEAQVDNININGNAITSTDTNGNIALTPNGTGEVDISKVDIDSGAIDGTTIGASSTAAGSFTTLQADTSLNVDGTVTADGLTVDGSSVVATFGNAASNNYAQIKRTTTNVATLTLGASSDLAQVTGGPALSLSTGAADGSSETRRMLISSGGDISFYDDTGVTQGFFWDASAESLGIGTTSPNNQLEIKSDTATVVARLACNTGSGRDYGVASNTTGDFGIYDYDASDYRFIINSSGNVGIGANSPNTNLVVLKNGSLATHPGVPNFIASFQNTDNTTEDAIVGITSSTSGSAKIHFGDTGNVNVGVIDYDNSDNSMRFSTSAAEAMRIDSSGNLMVGKTTTGAATDGFEANYNNYIISTSNGGPAAYFNRRTSDGSILEFRKDNTQYGYIGIYAGKPFLATPAAENYTGLLIQAEAIIPCHNNGAAGGNPRADNIVDLGSGTYRYDDVYATNGTIQTSDANEKQDIEALSDAEQRVAVAAKGLLRKYRWKSSVAEKGDEARIHFGIIAQDLKAAFEAEGLDAGRYAMFINSEWTDEETGEPRSRMGVRYNQLLAFIIAAI